MPLSPFSTSLSLLALTPSRGPCCGDASEGCWGSAVSDPTRTDTEYTRRRGRTVTGMSGSSAAHKGGFDSQRMGDRQCCRLRRGGTIGMDSIGLIGSDWRSGEARGSECGTARGSECRPECGPEWTGTGCTMPPPRSSILRIFRVITCWAMKARNTPRRTRGRYMESIPNAPVASWRQWGSRGETENLSKRNPCPEVRDAKLNRQPDRSYIRRIFREPSANLNCLK